MASSSQMNTPSLLYPMFFPKEDNIGSMASMANMAACFEASDSNSTCSTLFPLINRSQNDTTSSARFKGVVLQQNGHWGAQIYANHKRIWLGTFKSEKAAAMNYDSAAIKLHRGDSHRNFPWTELTVHEPAFQELFSTEMVLDMIRDGSYESKFSEFLRVTQSSIVSRPPPRDPFFRGNGIVHRELFHKELTPSDVGKLNRLVIPKKHAVQCFPRVLEAAEELLLEFRDNENQTWQFRYCYWKSSQSFVFTKGWNRFVKEKSLRAKDVVTFYRCEEKEGLQRSYCTIDITRGNNEGGFDGKDDWKVELQLGVGREDEGMEEEDGEVISGLTADAAVEGEPEKKRVRLFGVCIS